MHIPLRGEDNSICITNSEITPNAGLTASGVRSYQDSHFTIPIIFMRFAGHTVIFIVSMSLFYHFVKKLSTLFLYAKFTKMDSYF